MCILYWVFIVIVQLTRREAILSYDVIGHPVTKSMTEFLNYFLYILKVTVRDIHIRYEDVCVCVHVCALFSLYQVTVRDIHIRYEDDVTNPNSMVAAGITLHSLVLKVSSI